MKLDKLDEENTGPIVHPALILCEGKSDASFFKHLTAHRELHGFQIGFPTEETAGGFGRNAFGKYLRSLPLKDGFRNVLRTVVIATDCDDDSLASFRIVTDQIEHDAYNMPTVSFQIGMGARPHSLAIMTLPGEGQQGTLESLLMKAALDHFPDLVPCLSEYVRCSKAGEWPQIGQKDKMRLRSLIAASCQTDPECSLTWIFTKAWNPIPLGHESFNHLVAFLAAIP